MNKQDFISLLRQPDLPGKGHVSALKAIADDFPYFQQAQLVLAKALYNEKHYEFEKQLKHVAIMVPDRAVLFRYIHNLQEVPQQVWGAQTEPDPVIELPDNIVLPSPEPEPAQEAIPAEIIPISEEQQVPTPIDLIEPDLSPAIEALTVEVPLEPAVEVPAQSVQEIPENETHSMAEWLLLQQKAKIKIIAPTPEPPADTQEEQETKSPEQIQQEIAEQVQRSNVNEFESILDKFIRENPRISRHKAEFYNPVNMAKQSVEEDDELVTETLANVYYTQGHYKKAIRAYEKLCLIYPHKMTYFASLIQKIKTENKD